MPLAGQRGLSTICIDPGSSLQLLHVLVKMMSLQSSKMSLCASRLELAQLMTASFSGGCGSIGTKRERFALVLKYTPRRQGGWSLRKRQRKAGSEA